MAALLVLPDLKRCSMLSHLSKRSDKSGKRCQVTKAIESLQTNAAAWHHWTRVSIGEYSEFEYTVSFYSEKVWCSNVPMPIPTWRSPYCAIATQAVPGAGTSHLAEEKAQRTLHVSADSCLNPAESLQ